MANFSPWNKINRMSLLWSLARSVTCPTSGQADRWFRLLVLLVSHVQLFVIPQTIAHQAPLSMEFSRQEYWSGVPFPSLGEFSQPRGWTVFPVLAEEFFTMSHQGSPGDYSVYSLPSSPWTPGVEVLVSFNLCFLCSWKTESVSYSVVSKSLRPCGL